MSERYKLKLSLKKRVKEEEKKRKVKEIIFNIGKFLIVGEI